MYDEMNGTENYSNSDMRREPEGGVGFGIASLVIGIISLLLFCTCINIPLAILAIVFGIIQLVRGNGKGIAIGGLITSALSIIALVVFYLVMGMNMSKLSDMDSFLQQYEQMYPELFEDYDEPYYHYDDDDDTF